VCGIPVMKKFSNWWLTLDSGGMVRFLPYKLYKQSLDLLSRIKFNNPNYPT